MDPNPTRRAWFPWTLVIVVALSGAVRFTGLFNDLWLDEIWSIRSVEKITSVSQIFTGLLHDNNHPLNSLFLYLLMPAKADWSYRLLSWFSGTVSVGLAGLIARRQFQLLHPSENSERTDTAGLTTAALFGGSYFFIHYSSEARGYAPAVMFGLLALYAMSRSPERPTRVWAAIYGVACILGLLAHLAILHVMLAGLVWSATNAAQTWKSWRDRALHVACWQLGPWLFFGIYYFGFVRRLEIGGGPNNPLTGVLGDLAAYSFGFPESLGRVVALPVFVAVTLVGIILIARRHRALAVFYATAILIAPVLGLASSRFTLLFPRYFIVAAAFALLLAGYELGLLWNSRRIGHAVCLLVVAGFLAGNALHVSHLLRDGRGQYRGALRFVAEHTPSSAITVSSDNDGRNFSVMDYHRGAVGLGRSLNYFPVEQFPAGGPQWLFLHQLDGEAAPPDLMEVRGVRFQFERLFPHAALSGWSWYVYRNAGSIPAPSSSR